VLAILMFADQGLALWLNEEVAQNGSRLARILAIGGSMNRFGLIAHSFIQAAGHPDWTAKLQLLELPAYLLYLPWLVVEHGANGAALAWTLRVTISAMALAYLSRRALTSAHVASQNVMNRHS